MILPDFNTGGRYLRRRAARIGSIIGTADRITAARTARIGSSDGIILFTFTA
jgi:hypothetical protein